MSQRLADLFRLCRRHNNTLNVAQPTIPIPLSPAMPHHFGVGEYAANDTRKKTNHAQANVPNMITLPRLGSETLLRTSSA